MARRILGRSAWTQHTAFYTCHFLCRQHRSFHIDWEMVTFGFEIRKNL